jgi:CDP-6-deoxy-D-xylo-4-hexulose-3-dehydrase
MSESRTVDEKTLRQAVLEAAVAYNSRMHAPEAFTPGVSPVPVSGKCWDAAEMRNLVDASLDFWLTAGRYHEAFEKALAGRLNRRHALAVNSGSSANLLAIAALCSPKLGGKRLRPGDEVITAAAGFPTTVAPLIQHGLTPVFLDVTPPTYNIDAAQLEAALSPKTRAVFVAHTLGNPIDLSTVLAFTEAHDLWFVEDACDALGSLYKLPGGPPRPCGGFGHMASFSFYPAHHITTGEGGAVVCDDPELHRLALSLRDWGRDCWCAPGRDDTCKRRYAQKFPGLPDGYDHKYVYSHLGYNLKITDMQAAVGLAQLDKLETFGAARRRNFARLRAGLERLDAARGGPLILPEATAQSDPSWFGFPLTLARGDRRALLEHLNAGKIGTRPLFAGDITRQPCFEGVQFRQAGDLRGTDDIMRRTFWVGVFPGLADRHMDYMADVLCSWFDKS